MGAGGELRVADFAMIGPTGWKRGHRLAAALGAPGVIIGALSLLSFGFSLLVLLDEYHNPTQTGRSALHQVFEGWVRVGDYLGYTLVDRVERWQDAAGSDRERAERLIRRAVADLGEGLTRDDLRFRPIRLDRLDLGSGRSAPLVSWRPASSSLADPSVSAPLVDRIRVSPAKGPDRPAVELTIHYHLIEELAAAVTSVEKSYHRLVLALLGLSGYSLLCLGYMARHALTQQERVAREAAAAATLDLADRTCHELGNVAFVVANERRNLAGHIDLLERFVAEEAAVLAQAIPQAGIGPESGRRLEHALRRAYADRGIDPEFELKGSAAIARDVCRQIAICSDYIALTVRELDAHLKRTTVPSVTEAVRVGDILADSLTLLAPRIESSGARVEVPDPESLDLAVRADRRHLIHAIVNLIKNALEAGGTAADPPTSLRVGLTTDQGFAYLTIADNGPGIDPAHLRRIFEPGYSTKAVGRGLGLSIVRESIAAQGGSIDVTSRPGVGTSFRIGLPLAP